MEKTSTIYEPVVIVSNSLFGGGAEKSMQALHNELLKEGVLSYLVALNRSEPIKQTVNTIMLNRNWKDGIRSTVTNFLDFKNTLKKINPKTIIINCELPELYISVLKSSNKRIICVEHTTYPWYQKRFLGKVVRILLRIRGVEWVTVIKDRDKIWFGKNAISYIPNPFLTKYDSNRVLRKKPSLVFVGGMKDNKRPEWVIEAGIQNNLNVDLYGDGPLKPILEEKYKKFSDQIVFHGFQPNLWQKLSANALVVVPSEFEGDGMVAMEAIISGNPIALAENEDLKRFKLGKDHYFKDISALCKIVKMYQESNFKELRASNFIKTNLESTRSLKKITKQWLEILTAVKQNKSDQERRI